MAFALGTPFKRLALSLVPLAALPALAMGLLLPNYQVHLDWLLLGSQIGVHDLNRPFLLLASLLWLLAAMFARSWMAHDTNAKRFYLYFLLTMTGNLGAILAQDILTFYTLFALMTFSAFGLIIHDGKESSLRAGKVYLVLALVGEVLLLMALFTIGLRLGNVPLHQLTEFYGTLDNPHLTASLILAGFAIKMGAVPLHVWLALAHPCAPVPASAVLSGIIIKTGLLGWLQFLPMGGDVNLQTLGWVVIGSGFLTTFVGALLGVVQYKAKTVLAYSSISQMGLVSVLVGVALLLPQHWPTLVGIICLFALHHGLAKSALFLGVGAVSHGGQPLRWLIALPALALAGLPLTTGALAKGGMKEVFYLLPELPIAPWLLSASSILTTLLMVRFLYLVWPRQVDSVAFNRSHLAWILNIALVVSLPWWWAQQHAPIAVNSSWQSGAVGEGLLLVTGGVFLGYALWKSCSSIPAPLRIPEGDLVNPISGIIHYVVLWIVLHRGDLTLTGGNRKLTATRPQWLGPALKHTELFLRTTIIVGVLMVGLMAGLFVLL
ncbi:complex I subunit 5 family protein [Desulfurispira natronophila]|uniref:Formate hydrogenlyase subunit 3/multisubunit Na+/H+ antiporter MnhD subunit n=1 Tax=Desulfurispira natronophila TaxID=682562 RepID=A0A7W7Y4S4_9BACT|nr:complex I subunit 5 family protein [Desulfurispira natronophila]MBB5022075.1 formate hydrogenlyase subunit 3/multisubunit Na+/H+ antiporter MnhD subunit [Desulfurispira natronophila]